uniref:Uncharacterized protein n=1 Tax=Caenorhabditis japonica TaxID=281687 RepID=A0A8R1IG14_CAEJA
MDFPRRSRFKIRMTREESIEDDEESCENDEDLEQGQFFYDDVLQQRDEVQTDEGELTGYPESELSQIRTVLNQNCPKAELSRIRTALNQNCSYQNCPKAELSRIRTALNQNCPDSELFVSELPQIRTIQ